MCRIRTSVWVSVSCFKRTCNFSCRDGRNKKWTLLSAGTLSLIHSRSVLVDSQKHLADIDASGIGKTFANWENPKTEANVCNPYVCYLSRKTAGCFRLKVGHWQKLSPCLVYFLCYWETLDKGVDHRAFDAFSIASFRSSDLQEYTTSGNTRAVWYRADHSVRLTRHQTASNTQRSRVGKKETGQEFGRSLCVA